MREQIDTMLAHGKGRAEIIASFRKQYGEKILSAPTTQGFNLLAWTMPFVALLVGGGLVVLMMGRWRGGSSAPPQRRNRPAIQAQATPAILANPTPRFASVLNANCGSVFETVLYLAAVLIVASVALFVAAPLGGGLLATRRAGRDAAEAERLEHERGACDAGASRTGIRSRDGQAFRGRLRGAA